RTDVAALIQSLESVLAEAETARRVEEEKARRQAKARRHEKKDRPDAAQKTEAVIAPVPRAAPGSGIAAWIASLPSETSWSIPLGVIGIFFLGWLLPSTLFAMRFAWGAWSLFYGIAGLAVVGVTFYRRRDVLGGAELALYWYAVISAVAIIVLSVVTSL